MSIVGKWFGFGRDERYDTGVRAFERGEFELAAESFEACMQQTTDATTRRLARFTLGQCHARLGQIAMGDGDFVAAAAQYQNALDLNPSYPDLHYQLATTFGLTGQVDKQEAELRFALEINPVYAEALLQLGSVLYAAGKKVEGMELVVRAVRTGHGIEADNYRAVAEAHQAGDTERVIALLADLSVDASSPAAQQVRIGDGHVAARRFLEASHAYEVALSMVPGYADVRCKYGQTLLELDRVTEAAEEFKAALTVNPAYADAHAFHGIALRRQGLKAEAKESFNKALACNPDHPIASVEALRQ